MLHEVGHVVEYATVRAIQKETRAEQDAVDNLRTLLRDTGAGWRLKHLSEAAPDLDKLAEKHLLNQVRGGEISKSRILQMPLKSYIEYLRKDEELFARAYAQWITVRTQNPDLLDALNFYLRESSNQRCPEQWRTDEFQKISEAFDSLYNKLGWLQQPGH